MKPFEPAGGYPLGTIVALGENGLPERVIPRDWLTQHGKVKTQSAPLAMPNMIINSKTEFQQRLSVETVGSLPVEARQALNDVSGFVIHVEKATRHSLDMGQMALIDWLTRLSPDRKEDARTLEKIHLVRRGRQLYYIDEVIELQKGRYEATWNRNLNMSAKAAFEQLMGPVGKVSWAMNGDATVQISSGSSVFVAYKADR